ncbi:MAG: stage III sporulation protein AF [Clostridia bacterium]|nr:stage III sporulation protein AF [Clostridia bacterium]
MREYIIGLFALALCCAIVELLTPEGEGGGIARHIKLMTGLCLLCVLVTPLVSLVRMGADLPARLEEALSDWPAIKEQADQEFTDRWQEEYEQMDATLASQTIAHMLQERFSVASGDVSVEVRLDENQSHIAQIRIALSGRAIWLNTHEIERFIVETFDCECIIYME